MKTRETNMEKNFKEGDIIVVTSGRSALSMSIATGLWTCKFVRDLTKEEAVEIHYNNMTKEYPGMGITKEMVEKTINQYDKFFLNDQGEAITYDNHELADSFDKLYFKSPKRLSEISSLKGKYVTEFNIEPFKYPCDEWAEYRIYDDISSWLRDQNYVE